MTFDIPNKRTYTDQNLYKIIPADQLVITDIDRQLIIAVAPFAEGSAHRQSKTLRRQLYLLLPALLSGYVSPDLLRRINWPVVRRQCELLLINLRRRQACNLIR